MRRLLVCIQLVAAVAVAACGPGFHEQTPAGFVVLPDQNHYDYRAVSADGVVIAVRAIDDNPKGSLAFWTEAITDRLRRRGGYALLATRDVKTQSGLAGKEIQFGHDEGEKPHLYDVIVFVTGPTIYLIEAGGTNKEMKRHAADIDAAVRGFRIK